jgi:hypothetical protein
MVLGRAGKRGSARVFSDDRVEFSQDQIALWGWLLIIVYMAWLAVGTLMKSHGNLWDFFIPTCIGLMALSFLFSLPGTVVVSDDGVEQIYWFRRHKRICWMDIVEIESGPRDLLVTITGADGTKIVHSRFLADRPRLLLELKRRCGDELPPDFPREPLDGL